MNSISIRLIFNRLVKLFYASKIRKPTYLTFILLFLALGNAYGFTINIVYPKDFVYPKKRDKSLWGLAAVNQIYSAAYSVSKFIGGNDTLTVFVSTKDLKGVAAGEAQPLKAKINTPTQFIADTSELIIDSMTLAEVAQGGSIYELVIHELFHCLGVSKHIKAFKGLEKNGYFTGSMTYLMNGGKNAPLSADLSHFDRDSIYPLDIIPCMINGGASYPTVLDLALLADIGYQIPILVGKTAPFTIGIDITDWCDPVVLKRGRVVNPYVYTYDSTRTIRGYSGNDKLGGGWCRELLMLGYGGNDTLEQRWGNVIVTMCGDGEPENFNWPSYTKNANVYRVLADPGMVEIYLGVNDIIEISSTSCNLTQKDLDDATIVESSREAVYNFSDQLAYRKYIYTLNVSCGYPSRSPRTMTIYSVNPPDRTKIVLK